MDYCWFFRCCTTTDMSKKNASGNSNVLSDRSVRTQPQPVGSMRMYQELDASYASKIEKDYRQIRKGMEVAPRESVQQALCIEPLNPATSVSEQKTPSVQQLGDLENRLKQAGPRKYDPADDADSEADSESESSDYGGSDLTTDAGDFGRINHSEELSDGDSTAEIGTATQISVKHVLVDISAARLDSLETPKDEQLFVISDEQDEDNDSGSVSYIARERLADSIKAHLTIGLEAMAPSAEFRQLREAGPKLEITGDVKELCGPLQKDLAVDDDETTIVNQSAFKDTTNNAREKS